MVKGPKRFCENFYTGNQTRPKGNFILCCSHDSRHKWGILFSRKKWWWLLTFPNPSCFFYRILIPLVAIACLDASRNFFFLALMMPTSKQRELCLLGSANPMRIMEGIFFTLEMIFCRSSDGDWARFMRSSFRHLCFIRLPLDVFGRSPKPLKRQKGRFKLKVMLRS